MTSGWGNWSRVCINWCVFFMSTTTTSQVKIQRYSQELSEYTFRQFCLASALLDAEAMPHILPAHRRLASQVKYVRLSFRTWISLFI